ncbi:MAG TPA: UbiA family prenyltransferase [Desulfatiglandales bacterium]|nr:UbiA family prenyltransferase [Desulfatiglandales bacterium]
MMGTGNISFWKSALTESLLGRRGFVKRSTLWLPLALFLWSNSIDDLRSGFILSIYLIVAVQCWGMACTMANDLSDTKEDSAAGKDRWISHLSVNQGRLIVIIVLAIGLLSIVMAKCDPGIIISFVATSVLGSLYSMGPFRFKERGLLGLLAYSLSVAMIYVLVPWMLFKSGIELLIMLFLAVMLDKWVNLHFHQVVDYQGDLQMDIGTYAVRVGLERTRESLRVASVLASLAMITVIVYTILLFNQERVWGVIIAITSIAVIAAVGIYIKYLKERSYNLSDLIKELSWIYLGLTYLLFRILPPFILVYLAIIEPVMWILVTLSLLSLMGESLYAIRYNHE